MMHIGEFAERTGLSSRTLRHYEEIGLIPPTGRTEGGFRLYTDEDLRRMLTIRRMKALGYSTTEMGQLLQLLDIFEGTSAKEDREVARTQLHETLEDARSRREKLARQVERAEGGTTSVPGWVCGCRPPTAHGARTWRTPTERSAQMLARTLMRCGGWA